MPVRVISQRDGRTKTRLYQIYTSMKDRCYRAKARDYARYGARGIKVCSEWLDSFYAFRDWALQNGYTDSLTLDRRDTTGNYEPAIADGLPTRSRLTIEVILSTSRMKALLELLLGGQSCLECPLLQYMDIINELVRRTL